MKQNTVVKGWLTILVILVTAGITSWVMLNNKPKQETGSPSYFPAEQVARNFSPGIIALEQAGLLAAGKTAIPTILAGSVPIHPDRGVCTGCHRVIQGRRGEPIPTITALSAIPHENRGVCFNCHMLVVGNNANMNANTPKAGLSVAAVRPVVVPNAQTAPGFQPALAPGKTARPVLEGEWLGIEVAPITSITAKQYGIPAGTAGLVISDSEPPASTAGLKAGDVVQLLGGAPIYCMSDFLSATRNGTLAQGIVEFLRNGQRMAVNVVNTTRQPLPPAAPVVRNIAPPAGVPAAMTLPNNGTSLYAGNPGSWGGSPMQF